MIVRGFKALSAKDDKGVEEIDLSMELNDGNVIVVSYKDEVRICPKELDSVVDAMYSLIQVDSLRSPRYPDINMSNLAGVIGNSNYGGCIGMSSHFTISVGLDITDETWMFTLQRIKSTYGDSVRECILVKDSDIRRAIIKGMLVLINREPLMKLGGGIAKSIKEIDEFRRS